MTTLTYGSTVITFSDDLLWVDEFAWRPVAQRRNYTIAGSLIVESALRAAGRPITLQGGQDYGWVERATLNALQAAAGLLNQTFTLNLRGSNRTVRFDNVSQAIEARQVIDYNNPDSTDTYEVTLRFIEV